MQLKPFRMLAGALVATSVYAAPALAQSDRDRSHMTSDYHTSKVMALQTAVDAGLTSADIKDVLPLLRDLRDARKAFFSSQSGIASDLMVETWENQKLRGNDRVMDSYNTYHDAHTSIWRTISDKVGADKSASLQRLIEPTREDASRHYVQSATITRIDSILGEWDRVVAARGGWGTAIPVTTITTTTRVEPSYFWAAPAMNVDELVDLLQMKLARSINSQPEALMALHHHRDLTNQDIAFLQDEKMWRWK
jgi:hypothetical protein